MAQFGNRDQIEDTSQDPAVVDYLIPLLRDYKFLITVTLL
jgi:hypothetical protein